MSYRALLFQSLFGAGDLAADGASAEEVANGQPHEQDSRNEDDVFGSHGVRPLVPLRVMARSSSPMRVSILL